MIFYLVDTKFFKKKRLKIVHQNVCTLKLEIEASTAEFMRHDMTARHPFENSTIPINLASLIWHRGWPAGKTYVCRFVVALLS